MTPREFANLMERELAANAHKGDFHEWKPTPLEAAQELLNHTAKLCFALGGCEGVTITEHAADVGNIAMRIADEFGLPTPIPTPDDSWAFGRSVETQVLAQGMMSAIRFGEQHGTRYQYEMRRLCALIDAAQPKDDDVCQTLANITGESPSSAAANGAVSKGTSTSSTKSSVPTGPTADAASRRITTLAKNKDVQSKHAARRATNPSNVREAAPAKTAAESKKQQSRGER